MTVNGKSRLCSWAGAAVLAVGIASLTDPKPMRADDKQESVATTYIGELAGAPESARVAFVVEGDKFVAYVCSGDQPFNNTFSRWFRGDVKGGGMAVTADGVELKATLKDGTVSGTLKKDKTHAFTARAIPGDANAGLFRAGERFGDDDYVVGWIIDEKENVVGTGGKKGGAVQTLPGPKGNGNLNAQVGDKKLEAGRVTGAGTGAKAVSTGRKLDAAAINEMLQDLVAERKATGGDAVHSMILHQVRRFVNGKKPETKLEEKTFAVLRKAPGDTLSTYLKLWDKLPQATRDTLLGPANALDANKALDSAQAKKLVSAMSQLRTVRPEGQPRTLSGTVKGVSIPVVKCVDETNPEALGSDEIFAIHTVIAGNGEPVIKRTGVLKGFDDGVQKSFPAADAAVFPLPGQTPADGAEIFVVTTLYEDDGSGVVAVLNLLKPLIEVGVIVAVETLNGDKKKLTDVEKVLIKVAVAAAIAGVSGPLADLLVQPLGTDSIVVRPDGSIASENGGTKDKMVFKKVKNGDVRFEYELKGFAVQK